MSITFNYLYKQNLNIITIDYDNDKYIPDIYSFDIDREKSAFINFRSVTIKDNQFQPDRIQYRTYKTFRKGIGIVKNSHEASLLNQTLCQAFKVNR